MAVGVAYGVLGTAAEGWPSRHPTSTLLVKYLMLFSGFRRSLAHDKPLLAYLPTAFCATHSCASGQLCSLAT